MDDISSSSVRNGSSSSSPSDSGGCTPYPLLSTPANPLTACFAKDGKCYKCNPDRGSECGNSWLWNSGFVEWNVGYWYNEIACGGESVSSSSSSSGDCAPYPLLSTPSDPLNACFETNGKCYKCNPDRGSECGNSWLWNSFRLDQVGYWFKEIACGESDIDDEEWESALCSGSNFLQKKSFSGNSKGTYDEKEYFSSRIFGKNTEFFFDALGRKTQIHPEIRRYLFAPKGDRNSNLGMSENSLFRMVMPDGSICGVEGDDYGVMEDGRLKGGIYCYNLKVEHHYERKVLFKIPDYFCGENGNLINFTFKYNYTPILTDEVNYVRAGYVFLNGHKTTKQEEDYFRKHEQRHQSDAKKITKTGGVVFMDKTICERDYCAWAEEMAKSLNIEKRNLYNAKIDSASDYYHDQCYNYGKCE